MITVAPGELTRVVTGLMCHVFTTRSTLYKHLLLNYFENTYSIISVKEMLEVLILNLFQLSKLFYKMVRAHLMAIFTLMVVQ